MLELADLLDRCQQGDDLAWEAVVRRFQNRIFGIAVHYLRDREEARDAAQEVFIRLYEQLPKLKSRDTFVPWLLRLARNVCIDRLRRIAARTPKHAVPVDASWDIASSEPTPEERGFAAARSRLLYRALGTLTSQSREIVLLKEIQQLKLREIAELLELPVGTVKSRSHRARVELADAVRALEAGA